MKRILAIIIVLSVMLTLFGCNKASDTDSQDTSEPTSTVAPEPSAISQTITGTITAVDGDTVTVESDDGESVIFTVGDFTVYSIDMSSMPSGNGGFGEGAGADGAAPLGNAPDMPSGGDKSGGTPPEMPEGGDRQGETPPEEPTDAGKGDGALPEGMENGGTPPEMPEGGSQSGGSKPDSMQNGDAGMEPGIEMLTVGTAVTVTVSAEGKATEIVIQMSGNAGGEPGGGNADISYNALNTYDRDTSLNGETFNSDGADENAILVTDGAVSAEGITVNRTSSDSTGGDNASFYGVGAAVLTNGGTISISDSTISTDSAGGTGVFAYGDGTAYVSDTVITTKQNTSGGIHVAGGGTLYAWDLDVTTSGESAAAIRSDRGSGTMVVDGGTYTSNGIGSPAIYSTADITVRDADLTANGSEAICIEGKNSIRLYDCELSGNMSDDSRNDCTWNVILYQSMSGDSDVGNSLFEMVGGKLTAKNGGVFYTTNTQSTFVLSGVDIVTPDDCAFFLKCTGNSNQRGWGTSGANGAQCSFTAIGQDMSGNIIWDSISTLDFYMTDGSTLTGAFIQDETNSGSGYASLNIGENCIWRVTGNSTLTSLTLSGNIVDESGKTVSIVGSDGTVFVSGDSDIVVTVESFSGAADLTGCSTVSSFSDFAVEKK